MFLGTTRCCHPEEPSVQFNKKYSSELQGVTMQKNPPFKSARNILSNYEEVPPRRTSRSKQREIFFRIKGRYHPEESTET
jgi:hypothetical protein